MTEMEHIPMSAEFRQELKRRYTRPLNRNILILFSCLLFVYAIIIISYYTATGQESKFATGPVIGITIGFVTMLSFFAFPKLRKINLYYLRDAEFGQIVKEHTYITRIFTTPSGINIYWLDCDAIKTFTPEPDYHFNEGDKVFIYYLKFSKEYLGYEL